MEAMQLSKKYHVETETGFTCRYVRSETEHFHPHCHDYYEIFLLVKNEAWHKINGEKQFLVRGDLIFIRDTDIHDYMPANGKSFDFVNVAFDKNFLEEIQEFLKDGFSFSRFFEPKLPPGVSLGNKECSELFSKISDLNTGECASEKIFKLKCLLFEVFTHYFKEEAEKKTQIPAWLERTCEKMKRRENFVAGIDRMIELSGKSREHLARSMKKYCKITVSEYIGELRLMCAADMLKYSNLSATEICYECGFTNVSWFYSLFKRRFLVSPQKFREACWHSEGIEKTDDYERRGWK